MSEPGGEVRVVLITAPDPEVGKRLARALVDRRLAACVNVLPGVVSIYHWEGAVQEDAEVLLVVKTGRAQWADLVGFLKTEHPYDTPECVALEPAAVESKYGAWVLAALRGHQ